MRFTIDRLDHLVITCTDLEITAAWYQRVLGMEREEYDPPHTSVFDAGATNRRTALRFAAQKINLHQAGGEFRPHAAEPTPGSQDLCFVTAVGPIDVVNHLHDCHVMVEDGPVQRIGALGPMVSVYCRDPDGNLIEIASYLDP